MKSSNSFSPLQRALVAATVVLTAGNVAAYAQTSSSRDTTSSPPSSSSSGYNSSSSSSNPSSSSSSMGSDQSSYSSSSTSSSDKLSWMDRRFVTKAAESGQDEISLAQLAAQKASNPDVKQFAQQLVDQHQQVNSQLMSLASNKNVKIDQEDATKDRAYRKMNKTSGNEFDREFVEHMVDQHEKDVKLYEKAASNAKDPEVRQFASSTLQHLRQHLATVQQLQQSIIPTGRSDSDSWRSSSGTSGTSGSSSGSGMSGSSSGMSGSSGSGSSSSGYGSGAGTGTSTSTTSPNR